MQDTQALIKTDPMNPVERAQNMFEQGPMTAVAAFFVIGFFVALFFLLRSKDKHQRVVSQLQAAQVEAISALTERHAAEMSALYTRERDRAVKHEVTMHSYLELMEDVRYIAFELRRVRAAREKRQQIEGDS